MRLKNHKVKRSGSFLPRVIPAKAGIHGINSSRNAVHFRVDSRLRGNDNKSVFAILSFLFLFSLLSLSIIPNKIWADDPLPAGIEIPDGPACFPCDDTANPCNDGNPCTDDRCVNLDNGTTGCEFTPNNNNQCSDGNACTTPDRCVNGVCQGGTQITCPADTDGNICTGLVCDATTGSCVSTNVSGPCDDGDPCTVNDNCTGGVCRGSPKVCDDADACTANSCDPQTGQCKFDLAQGAQCSKTTQCGGGLTCDLNTCKCAQSCNAGQPLPAGRQCNPDCPQGQACDADCSCKACPGNNNECTLACPGGQCVIQNGQCKCERKCSAGPKQPGELCRNDCPQGAACNENCVCEQPCSANAGAPPGGVQCKNDCPQGMQCNLQQCKCERPCSQGPKQPGEICVDNCPQNTQCDQNTCVCRQPCNANLGGKVPGAQCQPNCPQGQACNPLICSCVPCPSNTGRCTLDCPGGSTCVFKNGQCACERRCTVGPKQDGEICRDDCPNKNLGVFCDQNTCTCQQPCQAGIGAPGAGVQCQPNCPQDQGLACNANTCTCVQCPAAGGGCPAGFCPPGTACKIENGQCKCERLCSQGPKQGNELCKNDCPQGAVCNQNCVCEQPCSAKLGPPQVGVCRDDCPQGQACDGNCNCVQCPIGNQCTLVCPGGVCVIKDGKCFCERLCNQGPKQPGELCRPACPVGAICDDENCTCKPPCGDTAPQCNGNCPNDAQGNAQACVARPNGACACGPPTCDQAVPQGGQCAPGCPNGQVCRPTPNGQGCQCVNQCPEGQAGVQCGGVCPNQNQQCATVGARCQCVTPCPQTAPQCGGNCPNDAQGNAQACKPQAGGACVCGPPDCDKQVPQAGQCKPGCPQGEICLPVAGGQKCQCVKACPEGQAGVQCGGICPNQNQQCATVGGKCQCVTACANTAPQCNGNCPNDAQGNLQACKAQAGGACICAPPDCDQQVPQGGQCKPGCPQGQICVPDVNGQKCKCEPACPEGQQGVQCGGKCPNANQQCATVGNKCQCVTPCPQSAPQCGGNCPNDAQGRPQACKAQAGGVCVCGPPDCDKQVPDGGGQCQPGCPQGQICQPNANKTKCECVKACPEGQQGVQCGGKCPNQNQQCSTVGGKCQCITPCDKTAPQCNGNCPDDAQGRPQACKAQAGGACQCGPPDCDKQVPAGGQCRPGCPAGNVCQPTADGAKCECIKVCPVGQAGVQCGGKCPDANQQCATVGNKCQCVTPCDKAGAPQCNGVCPNDANGQAQACKPPQAAGGACVCGPPDCDQQAPFGEPKQCRPGCPNGQVCQPNANGRRCVCVKACPEGQAGVQCGGVCPAPKECTTDAGACQCKLPVSCIAGVAPQQGEFCKDDCRRNQDPKKRKCEPLQCKCVECLVAGDCPNKACQTKTCQNNACVYQAAPGAQCGAPGLACPAGQQCQNCRCVAPPPPGPQPVPPLGGGFPIPPGGQPPQGPGGFWLPFFGRPLNCPPGTQYIQLSCFIAQGLGLQGIPMGTGCCVVPPQPPAQQQPQPPPPPARAGGGPPQGGGGGAPLCPCRVGGRLYEGCTIPANQITDADRNNLARDEALNLPDEEKAKRKDDGTFKERQISDGPRGQEPNQYYVVWDPAFCAKKNARMSYTDPDGNYLGEGRNAKRQDKPQCDGDRRGDVPEILRIFVRDFPCLASVQSCWRPQCEDCFDCVDTPARRAALKKAKDLRQRQLDIYKRLSEIDKELDALCFIANRCHTKDAFGVLSTIKNDPFNQRQVQEALDAYRAAKANADANPNDQAAQNAAEEARKKLQDKIALWGNVPFIRNPNNPDDLIRDPNILNKVTDLLTNSNNIDEAMRNAMRDAARLKDEEKRLREEAECKRDAKDNIIGHGIDCLGKGKLPDALAAVPCMDCVKLKITEGFNFCGPPLDNKGNLKFPDQKERQANEGDFCLTLDAEDKPTGKMGICVRHLPGEKDHNGNRHKCCFLDCVGGPVECPPEVVAAFAAGFNNLPNNINIAIARRRNEAPPGGEEEKEAWIEKLGGWVLGEKKAWAAEKVEMEIDAIEGKFTYSCDGKPVELGLGFDYWMGPDEFRIEPDEIPSLREKVAEYVEVINKRLEDCKNGTADGPCLCTPEQCGQTCEVRAQCKGYICTQQREELAAWLGEDVTKEELDAWYEWLYGETCKPCPVNVHHKIECLCCGDGRVNRPPNGEEQCDDLSTASYDCQISAQRGEAPGGCRDGNCTCDDYCQCVPVSTCDIKATCGDNTLHPQRSIPMPTGDGKIEETFSVCTESQGRVCCPQVSEGSEPGYYEIKIETMCKPDNMCAEKTVKCPCPGMCELCLETNGICVTGSGGGTEVSGIAIPVTVFAKPESDSRCLNPVDIKVTGNEMQGGTTGLATVKPRYDLLPQKEVNRQHSVQIDYFNPNDPVVSAAYLKFEAEGAYVTAPILYVNRQRITVPGTLSLPEGFKLDGDCNVSCSGEPVCFADRAEPKLSDNVRIENIQVTTKGGGTLTVTEPGSEAHGCVYRCPNFENILEANLASNDISGTVPLKRLTTDVHCPDLEAEVLCDFSIRIPDEFIGSTFLCSKKQAVNPEESQLEKEKLIV